MTEASSPPKASYGRIARFKGFLPLNDEPSPMATHGSGTLSSLIRVRSHTSLSSAAHRRQSMARDALDPDEEAGSLEFAARRPWEDDPYRLNLERRASEVLMTPQMRSMRLIGNSNPRYRWSQYWKTEDELKRMKKPM